MSLRLNNQSKKAKKRGTKRKKKTFKLHSLDGVEAKQVLKIRFSRNCTLLEQNKGGRCTVKDRILQLREIPIHLCKQLVISVMQITDTFKEGKEKKLHISCILRGLSFFFFIYFY